MSEIDKKGFFYLGKTMDPKSGKLTNDPLLIDSKEFNTHAVILGMTGSGKTGLGIDLLEEASLNSIPSIVIDPKGDLGNLLLTFPKQAAADFEPWTEGGDSDKIAQTWKEGQAKWGIDSSRIQKFVNSVDINIYTPASQAGLPISILSTLQAPPKDIVLDPTLMRDLVLSTTTSLLGLVGVDADPVQSKEHILLSTIIDQSWRQGKDLDLTSLIQTIQNPPFKKVGVVDLETFLSTKDRMNLSMKFNNLIAAPGFKAWLQGEKLDIQKLLSGAGNKPRLSILSIAHLNDAERMFFVTMLLNQLLNWMRRQSGTSQLRALLYMDEIFGYFPPNAMPPSKLPMLTLLKQARAFGLGIVLSTQNPVDLDYKGLANCGLWFIGKMQTERDKLRVGEGMRDAVGGDLDELKKYFALSNKRVFILKSIYESHLKIFQTRWSMSYLFGPLTLPQIERLTKHEARSEVVEQPVASQAQKPSVPLGVPEFFWNKIGTNALKPNKPFVLCRAKVHFVDSKNNIDTWKNLDYVVPAKNDEDGLDWSSAQDAKDIIPNLDKNPPKNGVYADLPSYLISQKNYSAISKEFGLWIYQTQELTLFYAPKLKLYSQLDETEEGFKQRLQDIQRANDVAAKETVRMKYQTRISQLQDRLRRAQEKLTKQQGQVWRQWFDTILSFISTIIGAFLGRSRISKTTINQAGTSIRRAGRIQKEQTEASAANEEIQHIQDELNQVQDQMNQEMMVVSAPVAIEKVKIPPRKSDISVETVGLAWLPL